MTDTEFEVRQANCLYQIGRLLAEDDDNAYGAILEAIARAAHELTGAHGTSLAGLGFMPIYRGAAPADSEDSAGAVRARVSVPLIWHARPYGELSLSYAAPDAAGPEVVALVTALAEQAAAVVQRSRDQAESAAIARRYAESTRQLERIQQKLILNEKLTTIGGLIQGFAHDINTPLSVVITNLSVLKDHTHNLGGIAQAVQDVLPALLANPSSAVLVAPLDTAVQGADLAYTLEDLPELMTESSTAAGHIAELVHSIASFARSDTSAPSLLDIRDVLESALALSSNPLKQSAQTVRDLGDTPPVFGLTSELRELFVHLLINAANALKGRVGTVTVSTAYEDGNVVVRIGDTGCGITADNLVRVFDPFFSTDAVAASTGMGLAVCHGIVTRHAGSISLASEPGVGTTVTVRLPAAEAGQVAA